jgi:RNA polymerase sigma factor (sigma-70 family)
MAGATNAAIEDVYRRRYPQFLRVAWALLGAREPARDAVQEAFARALRSRGSFRGEGSLEAWIWRMLVNTCSDNRRLPAPPPPLDDAVAADDGWPELRDAVAGLPERQRLVLFLRHYADLDYESIGAALGIRRGTVAAALSAAHRRLRSELEEPVR